MAALRSLVATIWAEQAVQVFLVFTATRNDHEPAPIGWVEVMEVGRYLMNRRGEPMIRP